MMSLQAYFPIWGENNHKLTKISQNNGFLTKNKTVNVENNYFTFENKLRKNFLSLNSIDTNMQEQDEFIKNSENELIIMFSKIYLNDSKESVLSSVFINAVKNKLSLRTIVKKQVSTTANQYYITIKNSELADIFKDDIVYTLLLNNIISKIEDAYKVTVKVFDKNDEFLENKLAEFESELKKASKMSYSLKIPSQIAKKLKDDSYIFVIEPSHEKLKELLFFVDFVKTRLGALKLLKKSRQLEIYKKGLEKEIELIEKFVKVAEYYREKELLNNNFIFELLRDEKLLEEQYNLIFNKKEEETKQKQSKLIVQEKFTDEIKKKKERYRRLFENFKATYLKKLDKMSEIEREKSYKNIMQKIKFVQEYLHYCDFNVSKETVVNFLNYLQFEREVKTGKKKVIGVSNETFNKYKSHLRDFFQFTADYDLITILKNTRFAGEKRKREVKAVFIDDIKAVIKQIRESKKFTEQEKDELIALILLGAVSGIRIAEAMRLKVNEIDFEHRIVLVRAEKTKKDYGRLAFITEEVRDYLLNNVVKKYNKKADDYLFDRSLRVFRCDKNNKYRVSEELQKRGINFTVSSLRKFYTTFVRKADISVKEIQEKLKELEKRTAGHKDESVVYKSYLLTELKAEEIFERKELLELLKTDLALYDAIFENIHFLD